MEISFSKKLLVVGDVMLDQYTATTVRRISPEAPVPVASVESRWNVPGGAANVARNLAGLGCQVTVVGVVGEDRHAAQFAEVLQENAIQNGVLSTDDRPTTCKRRILASGQQLLRLDEESTAPLPKDCAQRVWKTLEGELSRADALILSDYGKGVLKGEIEGRTLAAMSICAGKARKIPVLVDPKGRDWSCYRGADCITPNTKEITEVLRCGSGDFSALCREAFHLMEGLDLPQLLITRGALGMALLAHGEVSTIATRAQEVCDVSGAGDTVIAVLAACVAEGLSWRRSAEIANRAAGLVVRRVGTSPIHKDELLSALASDTNSFSLSLNALSAKIMTRARLLETVADWKRRGKRIVFTNGCFDLVHPGHVKLLQEASRLGEILIVALNADASVKRLKGPNRPLQSEQARAVVVASMEGVDAVVLFEEDTPLSLIEQIAPDVLVKGGDYTEDAVVGASFVQSHGGRVHLVDFVQGFSTTGIVNAVTEE